MAEWKGAQQFGSPRLYKIANSIDRIHRDIGHFASGFRRLGIDACNQDDRNRGSNELCKLYEDELRESGQEQEPPLKLQETTEQPDAEDGAPQLLACQLIGCPLLIWSVSWPV
jgi:hypothetical protein